jgi:hypothetical protein
MLKGASEASNSAPADKQPPGPFASMHRRRMLTLRAIPLPPQLA